MIPNWYHDECVLLSGIESRFKIVCSILEATEHCYIRCNQGSAIVAPQHIHAIDSRFHVASTSTVSWYIAWMSWHSRYCPTCSWQCCFSMDSNIHLVSYKGFSYCSYKLNSRIRTFVCLPRVLKHCSRRISLPGTVRILILIVTQTPCIPNHVMQPVYMVSCV